MDHSDPEVRDSAPHAGVDPGDSMTRRGEDASETSGKEPGREDAGTQGATERPVGTSTARDSTSVGPQDAIDGDSPDMVSGR